MAAATYDALWPGHPPVWVLTDSGPPGRAEVIRSGPADWVGVVGYGIEALLARGHIELDDWIVLVIEDHTATDVLDGALITEVIACAEARGAHFVRLHRCNTDADERVVASARGVPVLRMKPTWEWYHSLHPAAWRVDHLREILAAARARGATHPWAFERMPACGCEHLACDVGWPSRWGGYMKQGHIDRSAVFAMRHPALASLRRALVRDWFVQAIRRRVTRLVARLPRHAARAPSRGRG